MHHFGQTKQKHQVPDMKQNGFSSVHHFPRRGDRSPTLATFVHSAKLARSINRLIFNNWPNEELQKKLYTGAVESSFADPETECFKAVDDDSREIIDYVVLSRKQPSKKLSSIHGSENAQEGVPDGLNPGLMGEVMSATAGIAMEVEGMDRLGEFLLCVVLNKGMLIVDRGGVHVCEAKLSNTRNRL